MRLGSSHAKKALYRAGACVAVILLLAEIPAMAQVSSNTCGLNVANKYPVNSTCVPKAFNITSGYTSAYIPNTCNANNRKDGYGWFQATSTLTTVRYTPQSGADAILHVLSACNGAVVACADGLAAGGAETVTIPTVIGQNYYVRVQRLGTTIPNSIMNGTLCVFNPTCSYRLTLYDSYGDGWGDPNGQAFVNIIVNGVSLGLWSLNNGSAGYVDFGVTDGDIVQVIYSDGGAAYYFENSIALTVAGQCLFQTYAPPTIGVNYSSAADCTPSAAALPQDCVGGATICSSSNISNNSVNSGCALDLNASNQGCLGTFEHQGTWYYFSPSSSGTLGFTLTPSSTTDDYDFALWGPFDAVQCPTGAPVRCSYFNGSYYSSTTTGMGNGATDQTEGALKPPNTVDGWVQTLNVIAGKVYVLYIDNYSSSGQAFDLTWQLTNGASLDCTTLPVELISLEANARNPVIDITWATATEHNSNYFNVERSPDNETFTPIGTVGAAGNASFRSDYIFVDQAPLRGVNYYRLEQVDIDGSAVHSNTVTAMLTNARGRPSLFPNPASDRLDILFPEPLGSGAELVVLDALGRTVAAVGTSMLSGQRSATLNVDRLAPGWYNLRIELEDGSVIAGGGFLKK